MYDAASETRFAVPAEWIERSLVTARPGNGVRYPFEPGPETAAWFSDLVAEHRDAAIEAWEDPESDPDLAESALGYLRGEATPLGLSLVSAQLRHVRSRLVDYHHRDTVHYREEVEAWTRLHGLAFAAAAFVEGLSHDQVWGAEGEFPRRAPAASKGNWSIWMRPTGPVPRLRAMIANAGPDEYARVVAAVGDRRGTPGRRLAAAFLLPDEHEWVDDACDDIKSGAVEAISLEGPWRFVGTPDHLKRLGRKKINIRDLNEGTVPELVANLGADALPVLVGTFTYKSIGGTVRAKLFDGIAAIPSDEAMAHLLDRIGEPQVVEALVKAVSRFPLRAARLTPPRLAGYSAADRWKLAGVLRPAVDAAILDLLEPDAREAVEGLLGAGPLPEAPADRLPPVLVSPPWREARKTAEPLHGLEPPTGVTLHWEPAEFERAMAIRPAFREWDEDAYWAEVVGDVRNRAALELQSVVLSELARGGVAVADAVVEKIARKPAYGAALVPVRSAKAAHRAADWLVRLKSGRVHALDWLDRHGADAAPLLTPAALGGDKRTRPAAEAALRCAGRIAGHEAVLEAVAAQYGPDAVAAVRDLLDTPPDVPLGAAPKPGAWADARMLPPVTVKDGSAVLPHEAVVHLIAALSLWSPRLPYPGAEAVRDHCDAESLERFSIALFELWLSTGAPSADSWAVDQLGCFGTDATAVLLDGHVDDWAGHSHVDRARLGLTVLAHIGTATAFATIHRFGSLDKFPATTEFARGLAARLAARHGTDPETLADRLIPDLGVADPEILAIDYGHRQFRVRFDERLNPRLIDPSGRERKTLPTPGVRDDKATADASRKRYKRLLADLERLVHHEEARLEKSMMDRRTRTPADFRRLAAHPVMSTLARRLVWAADDGRSVRGFRVAEDGSLSDVDEHRFELPEDARILVAHPALIPAEVAAWTEILRDYAILQPFPQLTRPALAFTEDELATGRLRRFEGRAVRLGALADAVPIMRQYRSPDDHEYVHPLVRQVPGGCLLVDIDPPVTDFSPDPDGLHRLVSVHFATTANRHPDYAEPLPGKAIDPVTAAEVLGALTDACAP
ncbi:DUF4132 domain-containing protein [Glycomyces sp. NPDC049804]|uniref:DUF4132 domain-containing protein n=1 Tax=Glycomyces sp. NPDC049804 TaxID=3154363 RepID=UPI00343471C0